MEMIIFKILDILVGGIITIVFFGLVAMSIIGCLLLLRPLLKRPIRLDHFRAAPDSAIPEKQELTKQERYIWVQKLREFGKANLKKIFVSKATSKSMILATIGLIVLTLLFMLLAVMMEFRSN